MWQADPGEMEKHIIRTFLQTNKAWRLRQSSLSRSIKYRLVFCCQIMAGNTRIFLNHLEQENTSRMASSPQCITWMVVGLTESVTMIALNSLTVITFCRDHNLRKRSTYLVISLAVAEMLSGELLHSTSSIMLESCVTSRGTIERIGIGYQRSYSSGFSFVRLQI